MKKTFTFILGILFLSNIFAQDIKFGVKAGFIGGCIADEDYWSKPAPGYNIGLFAAYYVQDAIGVSIEPSIAKIGANKINILDFYSSASPKLYDYSTGEAITYDHHNLRLTMLELPVLVHYKIDMGSMGVRFFAGPSLDFILKGKVISYKKDVVAGDSYFKDIISEDEVTDRLEYYDFSGVVGLGVDMELDPIDLSIDLSYKHGFKNINNMSSKSDLRMRSLNLTVGIGINKLFF
jgi:hypothetical protein